MNQPSTRTLFSPTALVAAMLTAGIVWVFWPGWPTRELMTDLKWPVAAWGIALGMIVSLLETRTRRSALPSRRSGNLSFIWGATLILTGLAFSTAFSPARSLSFRIALRESVLIFWACRLAPHSFPRRSMGWVLGAYAVSASMQAMLTFFQYAFAVSGHGLAGRASMIGTLGNPEYVAGWIAPALALSVFAAGAGMLSKLKRSAFAGIVSVVGISIVLSGSRGAALSAAISVLCVGWLTRRGRAQARVEREATSRRAPKLLFVAAALIAVALIVTWTAVGSETRRQSLAGRLREMFDPQSPPIRHRVGLTIITSRMIADHPIFGCGPGRFGAAFDRTRGEMALRESGVGAWSYNEFQNDQPAAEAHCDPLQWWGEYGLLPFLGLMLILSSAVLTLTRRIATDEDPLVPQLLLAAILTLALGMMFSFPLHRPARAVLFWTLIGLAHMRQGTRDDS